MLGFSFLAWRRHIANIYQLVTAIMFLCQMTPTLNAKRANRSSESQQGEGWRLIKTHCGDGGLSDGTMERPALWHLLEDIRQKLVDVVVVCKVERSDIPLTTFVQEAR